MWRFKSQSATSKPNSDSTLLISGSFRQVIDYGTITVSAVRPGKTPVLLGKATVNFERADLDRGIDEIALRAGRWIDPAFRLVEADIAPKLGDPKVALFFRLRHQMELPNTLPDTALVLDLIETETEGVSAEAIAALVESMIVLSQIMEESDRKFLLQKSEAILRRSLLRHKENASLLSLFAEVFYLAEKENILVRKLALDALFADPLNDLAAVIQALRNGLGSPAGRESLKRLHTINPWLMPNSDKDAVQFQKGILTKRLLLRKI